MANQPYHRGMQMHRGSLDLDGFTDKIREMTAAAWGEDWGEFIQDEPTGNDPEEVILPKITFDTYERLPSKTHKSLAPIKFDTFRDPERPETLIEVYRQWFDVEVEFKVYHLTNRDARVLMEDFEGFLFTYREFFKDCGISELLFLAETKPQVVTRWGKKLSERNLRYLVRIERVQEVRSNILSDISTVRVDADVDGSGEKPTTISRTSPLMKNYSDMTSKL